MSDHFRGGIRIEGPERFLGSEGWGRTKQSWPRVRLKLTDQGIEMKWLLREIFIPADRVLKLEYFRYPWSWSGVRVFHSVDELAPFVLFTTFSGKRFAEALSKNGYQYVRHQKIPRTWWNPMDEEKQEDR